MVYIQLNLSIEATQKKIKKWSILQYFQPALSCHLTLTPSLPYIMHAIRRGKILLFDVFMVLHIISYKIITTEGIYTKFFPACLRHLVQCLQ